TWNSRPARAIWSSSGIGEIDLHIQQRSSKRLPLWIDAQRHCATTAQRVMQQKIERAEIRQLEALDLALHHFPEVGLYTRGRHFPQQNREIFLLPRDHADVGGVALIAGARVRNTRKRRLHSKIGRAHV